MSEAAVINVNGLSYAYPQADKNALSDISFEVARGEIFGLLGPSGAGKSTLQKILTRQIRHAPSGAVAVLGRDVAAWGASFYEKIGVGFELPNHYPRLTGRENLAFFASLYKGGVRDPDELLALVGLSAAADARVETYSKGMQVRLNFVRAIMHDPEILFLDEPMTGLDPTTAMALKEIIKDLRAGGKTIILTTHNMHDADELCDRVGFIAGGCLRAVDAPAALKSRYGQARVEVRLTDGRVSHFALDGLGRNQGFADFIRDETVASIHSGEASLDEVFGIVTGETLAGDGAMARKTLS